jgi:hypothetical protein
VWAALWGGASQGVGEEERGGAGEGGGEGHPPATMCHRMGRRSQLMGMSQLIDVLL